MWIFKSDVHWTVLMKPCCRGSTSSLSFLFTQCRSSCSDDISFVRSLKSLKLFVLHPFAGAQRLPLISWVQPSAHLKWVRTQMGLMFARQTSIQPPPPNRPSPPPASPPVMLFADALNETSQRGRKSLRMQSKLRLGRGGVAALTLLTQAGSERHSPQETL